MNQSFFKIWIVIILSIFVAGGILAWQWWVTKEETKHLEIKIPEIVRNEQESAESMITEFMNVRMDRNVNQAKSYLTNNGEQAYSQPYFIDYALVGISNPRYSRFEILRIEKLDFRKFNFVVRIYEYLVETRERGDFQYFDEELIVIKSDNKYLVDSVKRGDFVTIQDEIANWKIYRNEEYGYEIQYPENVFLKIPISTDNKFTQSFVIAIENSTDLVINKQASISIQIGQNPEQLNLTNWFEFSGDEVSWLSRKYMESKEIININNKECLRIISSTMAQGLHIDRWVHTLIPFKTKVVKISKVGSHTKYNLDKIYNQMLSTFRFLE